MKTFFAAVCFLLVSSSAFANGDLLENVFGDNNVYNDNRYQRKTYVKKVYQTKTIVKQAPAAPPQVVVVERPVVPAIRAVPVGMPGIAMVPGCRLQKAQAIVDAYNRVIDYTYVRVCY